MDTVMELMNKFYKGVTLNWACEHLSMGVYKNVSIKAWKRGIIKACEHRNMWSSKQVSMGACGNQGMLALENVMKKACKCVSI